MVKEYVFYTGADPDKRDPTGWTVERLNHGTWQTLGSRIGHAAGGRGLPYAPFSIIPSSRPTPAATQATALSPMPPGSPPPPPRYDRYQFVFTAIKGDP